jgi:Fic family protein
MRLQYGYVTATLRLFYGYVTALMWTPIYQITNQILNNIRQIAETLSEIKSLSINRATLAKIQYRAREISAYASTSIEGNPLSLTDVKHLLKHHPAALRDTEKEILNYNAALDHIYNQVKSHKFSLSLKTMETVQSLVVKDLMEDSEDCGQLRKKPVVIRDPRYLNSIIFMPPDVKDVRPLAQELCDFVQHHLHDLDPILLAGIFHKQFVIIHPFMEGNGRTTRLLTTAILGAAAFNFFDLFSFENYYNKNVTTYFKKVGLYGDYYDHHGRVDFTEWLEYFSGGILDELKRVQKSIILGLLAQERIPTHLNVILDYLKTNGSISQNDYGKISKRSLSARKKDFAHLVTLNLIRPIGHSRGTYYVLTDPLDEV